MQTQPWVLKLMRAVHLGAFCVIIANHWEGYFYVLKAASDVTTLCQAEQCLPEDDLPMQSYPQRRQHPL